MKKHVIILIVLAFIANVSAQITVDNAGNAGLGNAYPQHKLDVTGNARVAGSIYIGNDTASLGTTADFPLIFKVNNTIAGFTGNLNNPNVSFGYGALKNSFFEIYRTNTAIGYQALYSNTSGGSNTAIGYQALYFSKAGYGNVATGEQALYSNTSGHRNTALGYQALYSNTTGNDNVANGNSTLYKNTTGSNNVANGNGALGKNTTGFQNTASGYGALGRNTSGYRNTANGLIALAANTTGGYNTADGFSALHSNTTGSFNTAIGYQAGVSFNNLNNTIAIGYQAKATTSNQVKIGNSSIIEIGGYVNWTNFSDGRAKQNIAANIPGLEFINRLQPVTYNLDLKVIDELTKSDDPKINAHGDSLQAAMSPEERRITEEARANKESKIYSGFIAQDVEKAAKETGYDFSGVDAPENGKGPYGLRYAEFVVPLVKAVQELSKQNDLLQEQSKSKDEAIANLQEQNNNLQKQINELAGKNNAQEAIKSAVPAALPEAATGNASLEQNIPNPFNLNTVIKYYLPKTVITAQLCIYDLNGKQLKQIPLTGRGEGSQTISGSEFSAGIYLYALIADGQEVDVKRMILTE